MTITEENVLIGNSSFIKDTRNNLRSIAHSNAPVLISGPTGTGKTFLAKLIHDSGPRAGNKFININCASLNPGLFESEMFGHKKGSFTGAISNHIGKIAMADRGTLLLDEIADLSHQLQAKLLSVIEYPKITPLGSNKELSVDFRLITTTGENINNLLTEKILREDFFFRINVIHLIVPPLRERPEDIIPYFKEFTKELDIDLNNREIIKILTEYEWPGNLTEMHNIVSILSVLKKKITPELLKINLLSRSVPELTIVDDHYLPLKEVLETYCKYIYKNLKNKKKTAEILNIDIKTLNKYLK